MDLGSAITPTQDGGFIVLGEYNAISGEDAAIVTILTLEILLNSIIKVISFGKKVLIRIMVFWTGMCRCHNLYLRH